MKAMSAAGQEDSSTAVAAPQLGSELAALRWQIAREDQHRRHSLLALLATPLIVLASWFLSGIPAYLIAPYPPDSDDHTAFVQVIMTLAMLVCALLYIGACLYRHAQAVRRGEQHRLELFRLGGTAVQSEPTPESLAEGGPAGSNRGARVFLVHGHDNAALNEVARFIDRLGLDAVILRDLPSGGRTIMEKFMTLSDVDCAVVLLTPDDRGGPAGESVEGQRPRARQNVLLELGFFLGRLGRARVCVLYRPGVEIPSDYSGVLLVELDEKGAWKLPLAGELREAGLRVDMNLVIGRVNAL